MKEVVLKVMPLIFLCYPITPAVDSGSMILEVEPSCQ